MTDHLAPSRTAAAVARFWLAGVMATSAAPQGCMADAVTGAGHATPRATSPAANQRLGQMLAARRGWTGGQWRCLNRLWTRESGWRTRATNPSSGAYGIPQALPATKMATAGSDWRTGAQTQIRWGLSYIKGRYGTPCRAWAHETSQGWY